MLSQLIREGFIEQAQGVTDRRQRLLSLTEKGKMLEERLTDNQRRRIVRAYDDAGVESGLRVPEDTARYNVER